MVFAYFSTLQFGESGDVGASGESNPVSTSVDRTACQIKVSRSWRKHDRRRRKRIITLDTSVPDQHVIISWNPFLMSRYSILLLPTPSDL